MRCTECNQTIRSVFHLCEDGHHAETKHPDQDVRFVYEGVDKANLPLARCQTCGDLCRVSPTRRYWTVST